MLLNVLTLFSMQAQAILHLISLSSTLIRGRRGMFKSVTLVLSTIVRKLKMKNEMILSFQKVRVRNKRETSFLRHCHLLWL